MGIKEVVGNQARRARELEQIITDLKRQNAKLRAFALHVEDPECEICRFSHGCHTRERLFKEAFARRLQTLKVPE